MSDFLVSSQDLKCCCDENFPILKRKTFTTWAKKKKKVEKYCNDLQHNFLPLWQFCVEKELSATVGLSKNGKNHVREESQHTCSPPNKLPLLFLFNYTLITLLMFFSYFTINFDHFSPQTWKEEFTCTVLLRFRKEKIHESKNEKPWQKWSKN